MSMSQEEIEALMNGLDFEDDSSKEETAPKEQVETKDEIAQEPQEEQGTENSTMSEDDINDLIEQTENIVNSKNDDGEEESVDDILNSIEQSEATTDSTEKIDDILNEVETTEEAANYSEETDSSATSSTDEIEIKEETPSEEESASDEKKTPSVEESTSNEDEKYEGEFDEILSSIEGVEEESTKEESAESTKETVEESDKDGFTTEDIDSKIDNGVFPFPVEKDNKVVNQLSQVANDSEEKATKIFDVLSNILDYNNGIQNDVQELAAFNEKQTAMLSSLSQKFPNIDVFKQNLEQAEKMGSFISDINDKLNNGNMEIFEAMELMQYHDINRQKIERVMSVIRKLTVYLNNLFEDENEYQEISVAKHIHGDSSTGDLMAEDDLDALIAEFNK